MASCTGASLLLVIRCTAPSCCACALSRISCIWLPKAKASGTIVGKGSAGCPVLNVCLSSWAMALPLSAVDLGMWCIWHVGFYRLGQSYGFWNHRYVGA